jgi:hypothetical protein
VVSVVASYRLLLLTFTTVTCYHSRTSVGASWFVVESIARSLSFFFFLIMMGKEFAGCWMIASCEVAEHGKITQANQIDGYGSRASGSLVRQKQMPVA